MHTNLTAEDKIFLAIERLLCTSGHQAWHLTSVVDEASNYCYKTITGTIGTVNKKFIQERISAGLYWPHPGYVK